jgi:hypothetical protein
MLILDNLDVILSLVDRKGNPSPAKLSVRISQDSTSVVAGDALERAKTSAKEFSQPLISKVSDALTDTSDTLSNQEDLVASFNTLMKKFEPLVRIGDEVAKVRSSFSFIGLSESIKFSQDPSLGQFGVASTFCRNEGK